MYLIKNGAVRISVRNLVEFIYNSGDIDNRTGQAFDVERMQEGARVHRSIQKRMGPEYAAEVALKTDIPVEHKYSYVIALEGRADGIITKENDICIDEIKTVTGSVDKIEDAAFVHKAQAMCYAYIYGADQKLTRIRIRITYCSIDDEGIKYFYEDFTFDELQEWFEGLIDEFSKWTDFLIEQREIRTASIQGLRFPFEYRQGQKQLAASVYRSCEAGNNLYIQAPTGTGKTISTVYPAVMAVGEGHADKIFYLTAKTVTRTVAEDTYKILRENGLHFRTVTLTARDKICILEERDCNPDACPYAKGHFDRVNDAVYDVLTHETSVTRDKILEYADKHQVCPFEMSLDISTWCDGIICDYNYVFDPNVRLKRFFADGNKGEFIFLVDEAHNLVDRGRSMYSATLVKEDFLIIKKLVKNIDKKLYAALERCNKDLLEYKRECEDYIEHESISGFLLHLERVWSLLRNFMDRNKRFEHSKAVTEFFLKVRHFLNIYDLLTDKYVIYSEHDRDGNFCLRLFCVDPSDNLKMCTEQGVSAVFFSATLLPVQYFKEMLTGDPDETAVYAHSCFDVSNREILIGCDVSSRYTRRTEKEYKKIARYIFDLISAKAGNYMVFFPSYGFMREVREVIDEMLLDGELKTDGGSAFDSSQCPIRIVCQDMSMDEARREEFLSMFAKSPDEGNVTGFCVMGGIFSEGIDLKNEQLIGAVIVGAGLPMVCTEQKILQKYFDDTGKSGFDYAYVYPGMNKVMQAAGRVIRTEEDRGIIALLDERFLQSGYRNIFPREWKNFKTVSLATAKETARCFWGN